MISLSEEDFETMVSDGLEAIPEKFIGHIENVAITIAKEPTHAQREKMKLDPDSSLYGLYEGVPQTERGDYYTFVSPDKITIFRTPVLEHASTREEAAEIVKNTVWHEIAHHLGMTEDEVMDREHREGRDRF